MDLTEDWYCDSGDEVMMRLGIFRKTYYKSPYKEIPFKSYAKQIAEAANLSEIIVKTVLDKAVENGLVEPYGAGRGRNYMLSHKIYQDKSKTIGYVRQKDIDEARYPEMIVNMARKTEFIARADVVNLLHVNEDKAYNLLKALTKQGVLLMIHKGRYAKYKLNNK